MSQRARRLERIGLAAVVFAVAVSCGGCATLAHGTHQTVLIQSEPTGAAVSVNGHPVGDTPATVRLSRRHRPHLTLTKDGYERIELRLDRHASRWMIADVAIAMNPLQVQGWDSVHDWPQHIAASVATTVGVDLLTGGAYAFPAVVRVPLTPLPSTTSSATAPTPAQPHH